MTFDAPINTFVLVGFLYGDDLVMVEVVNPSGNLYSLFGAPIYISSNSYNVNENELKFIKEVEKRHQTSHISSRNDYLLDQDELHDLKQFCQSWLEEYVYGLLCIEKKIEFYITQSWSNYLDTHIDHHMHMHPNSIISGVFYVQTDGTPIQFYRKNQQSDLLLHLGFTENNEWNSDSVHFNSEQSKLFLFPSSLPHAVSVNQSNTQRISIAFNTFVKGDIGKADAYTRLVL